MAYYASAFTIPPHESGNERHPLISGVTSTSLGTLVSRVLGVVRESAAAGLLGLSNDGIMDAYVVAFRIPNLFRRLFGEGAMTASYLPEFAATLEHNRQSAWELLSTTGVLLAAALIVLVDSRPRGFVDCFGSSTAIRPP